jgi:GTPase SAR1 family protein
VTDDNSFRSLEEWLRQLDEHANIEKMIKVIVGNKCDVDKDERKINFKEGSTFAQQRGFQFFETSAIANSESINTVFSTLAQMLK